MTDCPPRYAFSAPGIRAAVYDSCIQCATSLRADVIYALERAHLHETSPRGRSVIAQILENARIASTDRIPLCQDTGTVWVRLEIGEELCIPAHILTGIHDAVAQAFQDAHLRMSVVHDALFNRENTNDNTPAFVEVALVAGAQVTLHLMLKGGGSDNASRVVMLAPGEGIEGVLRVVLECVAEKAANACPPLIIGIGVGSTLDKVANLSKQALLRPLGKSAATPEAAAFEKRVMEAVNATGIGPAALGGDTTALAVHLKTAPCHIAALPVAVNMGCCALRSASLTLALPSDMRKNHG